HSTAVDLYRLEPAPFPDRRTRAVDEPDRVNDPVPGYRGPTRSEMRPAPVDRSTLSRQGRLPRRGKSRGEAPDRRWLRVAGRLGAHSRAVGPPLGSARIGAGSRRRAIARSPTVQFQGSVIRRRNDRGDVVSGWNRRSDAALRVLAEVSLLERRPPFRLSGRNQSHAPNL